MTDSRAASELVGFVFVFAIVILSVALVTVAGYQGLDQSRDAERLNNAERGFDLLADDIDDVARHGAPTRSTELRVTDADVSIGDPILVSVSGHPVENAATTTFDEQYALRTLVYDADTGSQVVYANGAVVRTDRNGAVLLREPDLLVSPNGTALTLVQLRPADAVGVGGSGTVQLRVTGDEPELTVAESTPHVVTVTVTTSNAATADAWERYFQGLTADTPSLTCSRPAADTVSCTWTTDRVYVTTVGTELRFE